MAEKEAETKLAERTLAPTGGWTFEVVVMAGPDVGTRLVLDGASPRRVVGKSRLCQLVLTDPEVSRRHLTLESAPLGLHVHDLGSRNGTYLSGVRIDSAFATGGETIRVGQTELAVSRSSDERVALARAMRFGRFIGGSSAVRKLYPIMKRLAESDVSVVIEGATGTGKELVAEALHEEGPREHGSFCVLDCGALAAAELDLTLAGDPGGRASLFEQAHEGTLFLDDVTALDLPSQAKLLAALERKPATLDVRVIASTARDLDVEVQEGRFREDLYYRLAVAQIELPRLGEREGDVDLLARHFWSRLGGKGELGASVVARLVHSDWPGNVRELRNAVARLVALGDQSELGMLPLGAASTEPTKGDFDRVLAMDLALPVARQKIVDAFEQLYIERALVKSGGNVSAAAAAAGIARRYFYVVKNRVSGSGKG